MRARLYQETIFQVHNVLIWFTSDSFIPSIEKAEIDCQEASVELELRKIPVAFLVWYSLF